MRATSASARALTTAARSLASRPSERSGCVAVERLGHDHAEHRVAEELQPLVGGQPAVLVGVGTVGQGAVEQLGVQDRVAERVRAGRRTAGGRRSHPRRDWSEDRPTVGARAVLAALRAGAVRQVLGTAGRVGAGHQRGRDGLPLRATVTRVAARHLPLRDSHCSLLLVPGPARREPVVSVASGASSCRAAHRGSTGSSCWCSGSSASRAPHSTHSPGQSSRHSGWNGSASTTASRSSGSRSTRSPSSRLVSSSSVVRRLVPLVVDEQLLEVSERSLC